MPSKAIRRRFQCCLAGVLAVVMMSGGQWHVLQTIAWARMIVVYAQHDSLAGALVKTFDGRHPCSLCLQIRQGQQEEQKKGSAPAWDRPEKVPELYCEGLGVEVPAAPVDFVQSFIPPEALHSEFFESPPTPPPRTAVDALL